MPIDQLRTDIFAADQLLPPYTHLNTHDPVSADGNVSGVDPTANTLTILAFSKPDQPKHLLCLPRSGVSAHRLYRNTSLSLKFDFLTCGIGSALILLRLAAAEKMSGNKMPRRLVTAPPPMCVVLWRTTGVLLDLDQVSGSQAKPSSAGGAGSSTCRTPSSNFAWMSSSFLHIAHVETTRAGAGEGFAPIAALLILFVVAAAAHCLNGQVAVVQIHLNVFLLAARQGQPLLRSHCPSV